MLGATLSRLHRAGKRQTEILPGVEWGRVDFHYHPLLGLIAAAILGGAVGVQRQAAHKPAGFRTHLLVAMACAAFAAVSVHYHDTRIAANVLTGIGFIGAGAIIRSGYSAQGVTTAASIWTVAAVGVACGFGESYGLYIAGVLTVITVAALSFSDAALISFLGFRRRANVAVELAIGKQVEQRVHNVFAAAKARYEATGTVTADASRNGGSMFMQFLVDYRDTDDLRRLVEQLCALDGVAHVRLNEPFLNG